MAIPFSELIQSDLFTFIIGNEKKAIVVHAAALAARSDVLTTLINGNMQEARSRSATIEDAEVDDFVRLCEFAYRGDYTTPAYEISETVPDDTQNDAASRIPPVIGESLSKNEQTENEEPLPSEGQIAEDTPLLVQGWGSTKCGKSKKKKTALGYPNYSHDAPASDMSTAAKFRERFDNKSFCRDGLPREPIIESFGTVFNTSSDQDFTSVFLAHARLFVLAEADRYLILPLKSLALHKLHKTLLNFKMYSSRIGDIVKLAKYAYSSGSGCERSENGGSNDLRQIVVEYIVRELDVIGGSKELLALIEEGGPFAADFWRLLWGTFFRCSFPSTRLEGKLEF